MPIRIKIRINLSAFDAPNKVVFTVILCTCFIVQTYLYLDDISPQLQEFFTLFPAPEGLLDR